MDFLPYPENAYVVGYLVRESKGILSCRDATDRLHHLLAGLPIPMDNACNIGTKAIQATTHGVED